MDKYIGFDVDDKKAMACIVQKGHPDKYDTLPIDVKVMKQWLTKKRRGKGQVHLTFEVCGRAGWLYDELSGSVDSLTVSNPSEMTWIYRTRKKTDRIDARKQALLLQMDMIPARSHAAGLGASMAGSDPAPTYYHEEFREGEKPDPGSGKESGRDPGGSCRQLVE